MDWKNGQPAQCVRKEIALLGISDPPEQILGSICRFSYENLLFCFGSRML
jgi:hypothetical protein